MYEIPTQAESFCGKFLSAVARRFPFDVWQVENETYSTSSQAGLPVSLVTIRTASILEKFEFVQ